MAATQSTMLAIGTMMPSFSLPEPAQGRVVSSDDLADTQGVVIAFICNHCPFVKHIRNELVSINDYCHEHGVKMIAINSNDYKQFPDDNPEKMIDAVQTHGFMFPYLLDETQQTARAFKAACTPDFFVFDRDRKLVYRGQLDDSRPGNEKPVTGADLRAAINALLYDDVEPPTVQFPSIGCNIKWKPGAEPSYT